MKRDFTGDNLERVDIYLDDAVDDQIVWDNLVSFFSDNLIPEVTDFYGKLTSAITSLTVKNEEEPSGEEVQRYYKNIVENYEGLRYQLHRMFERANEKDADFSKQGLSLLASGEAIQKELDDLIGIATPVGFVMHENKEKKQLS